MRRERLAYVRPALDAADALGAKPADAAYLTRVENPTAHDRVHLVADTAGSSAFWRLAAEGQHERFEQPPARVARIGGSSVRYEVGIFAQGAPLFQPNGVAIDPQGKVVVVNMGNPAVLTFSPDGALLKAEQASKVLFGGALSGLG